MNEEQLNMLTFFYLSENQPLTNKHRT